MDHGAQLPLPCVPPGLVSTAPPLPQPRPPLPPPRPPPQTPSSKMLPVCPPPPPPKRSLPRSKSLTCESQNIKKNQGSEMWADVSHCKKDNSSRRRRYRAHNATIISFSSAPPPGENVEVDIAILYASDGEKWKCYLYNVFTQLAPKEEGFRGIRVEVKNVQEIEDDIGRLQAVQLKGAKLQIVILSPCFLAHIAKPGRSEIGQLFKPEKVLALLLGVDDSQFTMAHRSALYSYNDWHRLRVRNMDLTFVYEVLFEGISILKSCELFSQYQDERNAEFKITPRKVNMVHQLLYIMMDKPVKSKNSVEVLIEGLNKYTSIKKFHLRNPYTIDFRMPEEFLRGSSLICVTVLVDKKRIGSRQLKCESSMDTLKTILTNVSNPTEFMCQALNINPTSDELDQKLADTVRFHLPPHRLGESNVQNRDGYKFPTWIHFSAYYGLERLIWALLEIPGGEAALNTTNCHGHTPSVLAYQKHFSTLAQKLEDAALVSSLAAKVGYMPEIRRAISMHGEAQGCEEMYNSPPPPRPLVSYQMYGYDSLPAPREVSSNTLVASPVRLEVSENLMTPSCSPPLSPALSGSEQHVPSPDIPSPLSPATRLHTSSSTTQQADYTNSVKDDRYLDMNVSSECQKEKEHVLEYSADVYTLVTAWREKTNIKTFVEKNQDKIVEVKSKLDSSKGKDPTDLAKDSTEIEMGAMSLPQGETAEPAEITAPDVIRRKSVVEQFFDLLRHKSENYNESSRVISNTSVNTSKSHPQLEMREDTQQNDIHSSGKTTVERLPQPPPRIEASNIYLQAEDINSPSLHEIKIHQEMIKSASISDLGKSCLPTSSAKYLNLPKNFATHTKKQDEDYSIYSTVN
nr:uncharacterized protein LOC128685113 isoform X2 [Cherax quadricarinatus]